MQAVQTSFVVEITLKRFDKIGLATALCITLLVLSSSDLQSQNNQEIFIKAPWKTESIEKDVTHFNHHFEQDSIFNSKQNIHYIQIKLSKAKKSLAIARADSGMVLTSILAQKSEAIAAINGSFFNTKTGVSVNFIKINGRVTDSTFYEDKQKDLKANQQGVLVFDSTGIEIISRNFEDKYWWVNGLKYENALESGPLLIKDNISKIPADTPFSKNRHPRSAVCLTDDSFILLTADGRNTNAYGLSVDELTHMLTWLNCKDALNLDGGGSTTLFIKKYGVVNMPSDNKQWDHEGERAVNNALLILPSHN
ncbi:MAG TPA: phosphodiester glycosidase family protein [Saprospiraceae bacterium]|nr:phosphodiester glycosidase family protein [Saprospiraceae bacterium]